MSLTLAEQGSPEGSFHCCYPRSSLLWGINKIPAISGIQLQQN